MTPKQVSTQLPHVAIDMAEDGHIGGSAGSRWLQ